MSNERWAVRVRTSACSVRRIHKSYNLTNPTKYCSKLLAGLARFAWVKQISIPIAVVLRCPFKISSTANEDILRWHLQYICSEKPFFALLRNRLYFANERPFIPQWIAFTLQRKRLSFFYGTRMSSEWWAVSDEGVGTLRAASEVSYSHNSRQSRKRLRAII